MCSSIDKSKGLQYYFQDDVNEFLLIFAFRFTFSIAAEVPPLGLFSIDPDSGRLSANQALDREHVAIHHLVVKATDAGESTLSSGVNVTVYVADQNDNAPLLEFPVPGNNTVEV